MNRQHTKITRAPLAKKVGGDAPDFDPFICHGLTPNTDTLCASFEVAIETAKQLNCITVEVPIADAPANARQVGALHGIAVILVRKAYTRPRKRRDIGLAKKSDRWTPEDDQLVTAMKENGARLHEIATCMGRTRHGIQNRLRLLKARHANN